LGDAGDPKDDDVADLEVALAQASPQRRRLALAPGLPFKLGGTGLELPARR
jgi:hypothetical protein